MGVDDLAGYLGVTPSTVYAWRYKGTGPPGRRVGKRIKYKPSEVDAWLERHS